MQDTSRPRVAMIVNPYSSGMTSKRERRIVLTLREHIELTVHRTERAGHATRLARDIVEENNTDIILACGGDGTANEALNGMNLHENSADERPAFAILPAGGTNVLARTLGFANHPIRATKALAQALNQQRSKPVNLGKVDERVFMFASGIGFDAEIIKRMEQRRSGRRPSDMATVASMIGIYAAQRFAFKDSMDIDIEKDGETKSIRAAMVMVGNTTPMTFVGRIPIHVMPQCSLETELDFVAPQNANALLAIRNAMQGIGVGRKRRMLVSDEKMQLHHNVQKLTVRCEEPQPVQADGEYLGERTVVRYTSIKNAIRLIS